MARKKNRGRRKNQQPDPAAVAVHMDGGTQRAYIVMDINATIVALIEDDRGWAALQDAGYAELPIYGPVQVEPVVVDRLLNVPKRERDMMGKVMAGLIGKPLTPYLAQGWGSGATAQSAQQAVQYKEQGRTRPYDEPLKASLGDLSGLKSKLLRRK
jgi:hypothetical protein